MTREEVIKIINCYDIGFYDLSGEKIPADKLAEAFHMAIEALQAEPVKHGEWKLDPNGMDWDIPAWRCSECGFVANYIGVEVNGLSNNPMNWAGSNFCPNCGAKMDKK